MAAQREWFEKDYYKVLGVARDGDRQGDHQGVPQAGARAAPRHEPRQRRGRGAVQGGLGGLRRARRRGQAEASTTRSAGSARWAADRRPGGPGGFTFNMDDANAEWARRPARADVRAAARPWRRRGRRPRRAAPRRRRRGRADARLRRRGARHDHDAAPHDRRAVLDVPRRRAPSPGTAPKLCPQCGGRGVIDDNQGLFSFSSPCRALRRRRHRHRGPVPDVLAAPASSAGRARSRRASPPACPTARRSA